LVFVQNVIDSKEQMTFKVLLSNRTPALRWGAIQIPRKKGEMGVEGLEPAVRG